MNQNNSTTIKVPKKLVEDIDLLIQDQKLGYVSRSDFARDAIRKRVSELTHQEGRPLDV